MSNKQISVGVEYTGNPKKFKAATEEAKKSVASLSRSITQNKIEAEKGFKSLVTAASAVKAAIIGGGVIVAINLMKKGFAESGEGADKLQRFTTQLKEGFDAVALSIAKADFANLARNWALASRAAGEYADEMDLMNDRLQDLSVKRAGVASDVAMLRAKQAEGTLTSEEAAQLRKSTEDLLLIETEIYDEAIKAQLDFIASKKGLDGQLFANIQAGIERRASMSKEEIEGLQDYVAQYTAYKKKLEAENITIQKVSGTSPSGQLVMTEKQVVDMVKVNEQLSIYLKHLPEVARLQILQQELSGEEEYNQLIQFMVKRNELEGEYAGLLRRTIGGQKATAKGVPGVPYVDPGQFKYPSITDYSLTSSKPGSYSGGLMGTTNTPDKIAEMKKLNEQIQWNIENGERLEMTWQEMSVVISQNIDSIASAFEGLGDAIKTASEDGSVSFAESMNIITEAATVTIAVMEALACAGMISKESEKGIVGVVSAIAGIATILSLFSSYAEPAKLASGGIAYGTTNATVGEYPDAKNNPEVIAPLSKLKGLIGGQQMTVLVKGKLSGKDIYLSSMRYGEVIYNNT